MTEKRITCIYCGEPIHVNQFAGIAEDGLFCTKTPCLLKSMKKLKGD